MSHINPTGPSHPKGKCPSCGACQECGARPAPYQPYRTYPWVYPQGWIPTAWWGVTYGQTTSGGQITGTTNYPNAT